jgi:protein-arginine kinase activator protein McsA
MMNCEVCNELRANYYVDRVWHDGSVDKNVHMCKVCAQSDKDGMFTIINETLTPHDE